MRYKTVIPVIDFIHQTAANSTVKVVAEVADITSNSEDLTAADISATSSVINQLTSEAVTNPEVTIKPHCKLCKT